MPSARLGGAALGARWLMSRALHGPPAPLRAVLQVLGGVSLLQVETLLEQVLLHVAGGEPRRCLDAGVQGGRR